MPERTKGLAWRASVGNHARVQIPPPAFFLKDLIIILGNFSFNTYRKLTVFDMFIDNSVSLIFAVETCLFMRW